MTGGATGQVEGHFARQFGLHPQAVVLAMAASSARTSSSKPSAAARRQATSLSNKLSALINCFCAFAGSGFLPRKARRTFDRRRAVHRPRPFADR